MHKSGKGELYFDMFSTGNFIQKSMETRNLDNSDKVKILISVMKIVLIITSRSDTLGTQ